MAVTGRGVGQGGDDGGSGRLRRRSHRAAAPVCVLVSPHPLFRELFATALGNRHRLRVTPVSPAAAVAVCEHHRPQIVIIDLLNEQTCPDVVESVAAACPDGRFVVIDDGAPRRPGDRSWSAEHVLVEGADGCAAVNRQIVRLLGAAAAEGGGLVESLLSSRELEVFEHIGQGLMTAEIAARLGISRQTVETHRKSISRKLRATRGDLVRQAVLHVSGGAAGRRGQRRLVDGD